MYEVARIVYSYSFASKRPSETAEIISTKMKTNPTKSAYEEGPVHLPNGIIVGKRWRIIKMLGEGGCGAVYMVEDMEDCQKYALKAESNNVAGGSVLKIEVDILMRLRGKAHVAALIHSGKRQSFQYMVMTLLGDSLNHLIKKAPRPCSMSTLVRVGINVLHGLKQIHDIGFVHRDIKPANLATGRVGTPEQRFLHILDFGLAREYILKSPETNETMMRRPRRRTLFRGTTRYCSVSTHDKNEQGRVDDLWSLLYVMVELRTRLPWAHLKDKHAIADCKKKTTDSELLDKCPVQLLEFAAHLRTLTYFHRPDYLFLYNILMEIMVEGAFRFSEPWDWEGRGLANRISRLVTQEKTQERSVEKTQDEERSPFKEEDFAINPFGF